MSGGGQQVPQNGSCMQKALSLYVPSLVLGTHSILGEHTADLTDVAQVDVRTMADAVNLGPHVQVFVEYNTQVAHLISGWNQTVSNTDARDGELPFLLR